MNALIEEWKEREKISAPRKYFERKEDEEDLKRLAHGIGIVLAEFQVSFSS